MGAIQSAFWAEFSDFPTLTEFTRTLLRLSVSVLLGGALGWERELSGKSAGVRTHILVATGCAFFVMVPAFQGADASSLSRVIQGITTGLGFIGAGTILKHPNGKVEGLTTAAGLWMTAAVGVAVGLGREGSAVLATLMTLLVLHTSGGHRSGSHV